MTEFIAKGSSLKLSDPPTAGSSYTTVGQITSIDGPSIEVRTVEVTDLSDSHAQYLPTTVDSGDFSFELNLDSGAHDPLTDLLATPVVAKWQALLSDGKTYSFDGILTQFNPSGGSTDDALTASCTIKLSGAVTITTTS